MRKRAVARAAGRIEIAIMTRHHKDLARLDGKESSGAPVGIGKWLVTDVPPFDCEFLRQTKPMVDLSRIVATNVTLFSLIVC